MVEPLRHRQTKGAATDMFYLTPPRHISTLHLTDIATAPVFVRYWTIADKGGFWAAMVCPLMTQLRHWLCTAALFLMSVSTPVKVLALQLRFLRSSESIGHHDSEIVDDGYFDRDDAGALGVIAAGSQSADGAIVHPGAGGGFCGLVPGRTTRRRAAQDRLDACGSGGRSRSLAPAGHSGSRMVGR